MLFIAPIAFTSWNICARSAGGVDSISFRVAADRYGSSSSIDFAASKTFRYCR